MRGWLAGAALLLSSAPQHFEDQGLRVAFTAPDGYLPNPTRTSPDELANYARGKPGEPGFGGLVVQALSKPIAPNTHLKLDVARRAAEETAAPSGIQVGKMELSEEHWKGFTLEAVTTELTAGDQHFVTYAIQVPLTPRAIQLQAMGPAADTARVQQDLRALLATVEGETNWHSRDDFISLLIGLVGGVLAVAIAVVVVLVVLLRRQRRKQNGWLKTDG